MIGVNAIGCCTIPSIAITVLLNFLVNSNSWEFPTPASVNVTDMPAAANCGVVDNLNVSGVRAIG